MKPGCRRFGGLFLSGVGFLFSGCGFGNGESPGGWETSHGDAGLVRRTLTVGIGDEHDALRERNRSFRAEVASLDEASSYGGDLIVRYDDGLISYEGCAQRVVIDSLLLSEDFEPLVDEAGSPKRERHVTAVFIKGCDYYQDIDDALEGARSAVRRVVSSPDYLIEAPRYSAVQLRQREQDNGLPCAGVENSITTPEQEVRCLVENERKVWRDYSGMERRVVFEVLEGEHARVHVSLILVNRRLSPIANSLGDGRRLEGLLFYVHITVSSRNMNS